MNRIIIGFGSKRRRGKNTAAQIAREYLDKEYNIQSIHTEFAYTLKRVVQLAFDFTDDQMEENKEVEDTFWKITPRWAMQTVGTECFRKHINQDFWVKNLIRRVQEYPKASYVISDVRFHNEAVAIKELGGYLVQVSRVVPPSKTKDFHDSETGLDGYIWDYKIENEGTIEELATKVHKIVDDIMRKQNG